MALRLYCSGDIHPDTRTRGRDTVWPGHAWMDGRKGDAGLARLAARLRSTGIRDLYVHTGPLEYDGSLGRRLYPRAKRLISKVHQRMPGVRVQAWLGRRLALDGRRKQSGPVLESAATRQRVVNSARQVHNRHAAGPAPPGEKVRGHGAGAPRGVAPAPPGRGGSAGGRQPARKPEQVLRRPSHRTP